MQFVPRNQNKHANTLATIGSLYDIPSEISKDRGKNHLKFIVRPNIPNNVESWKFFEFGNFLREEAKLAQPNQQKLQDHYDDQIIQLRSNKLSKGLVTLEYIFNTNDQLKKDKSSLQIKEEHYEEIEVAKDKRLKLGKVCTPKECQTFINLSNEFHDIIAWNYSDLKGFNPYVCQHTIDLALGAKSIRQKQRPINPKLEPLMIKELNKLIERKIIFPIKHTSWVSKLVSVRKKNGEIRLCVDFHDLNRASLKEGHPLPSMEQILQVVSSSEHF